MNTKNWRFVKDGLDDFRDGVPPPHDDIMLEVCTNHGFPGDRLDFLLDFNSQRKVQAR